MESPAGTSNSEKGVALPSCVTVAGFGDRGIVGTPCVLSDMCCDGRPSDFNTLTFSHSLTGARGEEEGVRGVSGLEGGWGGV